MEVELRVLRFILQDGVTYILRTDDFVIGFTLSGVGALSWSYLDPAVQDPSKFRFFLVVDKGPDFQIDIRPK